MGTQSLGVQDVRCQTDTLLLINCKKSCHEAAKFFYCWAMVVSDLYGDHGSAALCVLLHVEVPAMAT